MLVKDLMLLGQESWHSKQPEQDIVPILLVFPVHQETAVGACIISEDHRPWGIHLMQSEPALCPGGRYYLIPQGCSLHLSEIWPRKK
jgi:hypothetical protein